MAVPRDDDRVAAGAVARRRRASSAARPSITVSTRLRRAARPATCGAARGAGRHALELDHRLDVGGRKGDAAAGEAGDQQQLSHACAAFRARRARRSGRRGRSGRCCLAAAAGGAQAHDVGRRPGTVARPRSAIRMSAGSRPAPSRCGSRGSRSAAGAYCRSRDRPPAARRPAGAVRPRTASRMSGEQPVRDRAARPGAVDRATPATSPGAGARVQIERRASGCRSPRQSHRRSRSRRRSAAGCAACRRPARRRSRRAAGCGSPSATRSLPALKRDRLGRHVLDPLDQADRHRRGGRRRACGTAAGWSRAPASACFRVGARACARSRLRRSVMPAHLAMPDGSSSRIGRPSSASVVPA